MQVDELTLPSKSLGGLPVQVRVLRPAELGNQPLPLIYFLHGRGASPKMLEELQLIPLLEKLYRNPRQRFIVVSPQGSMPIPDKSSFYDSYWTNSVGLPELKFADMVMQELLPFIEGKYPVMKGFAGRAIAGISMGGAGAMQLALNNPGSFRCVVGQSPVFRMRYTARRDFPLVYGSRREDFDSRSAITLIEPYILRPQQRPLPRPFERVFLHMGGGEGDEWLGRALEMSDLLERAGYAEAYGNRYDIGETAPVARHDFPYWKSRMPEVFHWLSRECFRILP